MDTHQVTQKLTGNDTEQYSSIKKPPVSTPLVSYFLHSFQGQRLTFRKRTVIYLLTVLILVIPIKFTTKADKGSPRAAGGPDAAASKAEMKLRGRVARYDDGNIVLQWKVTDGAENLGFNIYREDKQGSRKKLNATIIGGTGLMVSANTARVSEQTFSWLDNSAGASRKAVYFIEDLDLSGHKTFHGPFTVERLNGKAPVVTRRNSTLGIDDAAAQINYPADAQSGAQPAGELMASTLQGNSKANGEPMAAGQQSTQFDLAANGQAIKIGVKQEGWYRVSYAELRGAGLSATVNPKRLKLMIGGVEQPMVVNGEADGRFDPADSIEFYGTGVDTLATDKQVYWLVEGGTLGKRITASKSTGNGMSPSGYRCTMERSDRSIYFGGLINGDADNYFGAMVMSDGVDQNVELKMVDRNSASAVLEVALQGVSDINHRVSVSLNGQYLGEAQYYGKGATTFRADVAQSLLAEGSNTVHLGALEGGSDISLVDYIRVNYQHQYATTNNQLLMSATDGNALMVRGFSEGRIRVMDVTDPQKVQELQGEVMQEGSGYAVKLLVKQRGTRKLLAFADSQASLVDEVKANQPSSWNARTNGADLLVLTHERFLGSLTPLVNLRRAQGYQVAVVNVEDAYDEFGYGVKSAGAVKELLRLTQSWRVAPHYVLVVGDASVDPRQFVWQTNADFVPTKMVNTLFVECPSDDWLVDFNDDYLPELALGRLPAKNEAEAQMLVQKVVAYEQQAAGSQSLRSILLVSDANDGYDFEAFNDDLIPLLPSETQVGKVYRGQLGDTAKSQLMAAINQGPSIVNYKGHGSNGLWRGNLLMVGDAATMTNAQNLSFFISMTCLNSMYVFPEDECLSSDLLKAPNGGAIAVWSSSALTYPDAQNPMNAEILRRLSATSTMTIGEAARLAKGATTDSDARQSWILLGDPLCHVK